MNYRPFSEKKPKFGGKNECYGCFYKNRQGECIAKKGDYCKTLKQRY